MTFITKTAILDVVTTRGIHVSQTQLVHVSITGRRSVISLTTSLCVHSAISIVHIGTSAYRAQRWRPVDYSTIMPQSSLLYSCHFGVSVSFLLIFVFHFNPYPAAKVYTSAISTAAKVSINKCSTKDAHKPTLSPYSIFIFMFTIINIVWKF